MYHQEFSKLMKSSSLLKLITRLVSGFSTGKKHFNTFPMRFPKSLLKLLSKMLGTA